MDNIIVALLTSVVTAAVTIYLASRTIFNNTVAPERVKWRQTIKDTVVGINYSSPQSIAQAIDILSLNLNPFDDADRAIIDQLNTIKVKVSDGQDVTQDREDVFYNVAFLLKHDWERQKHESSLCHFKQSEPKRAVVDNVFFKNRHRIISRKVCCGRAGQCENRFERVNPRCDRV